MDEERKVAWAGRLENFPLLRMLLLEKWFRFAFLFFVVVLLGGLLFLPRIWVVSPKGFRPVVKISLLDRVQAASLKRTARKAAAAGQFEEANYAWQTAIANNRADLQAIRELLENFLDHEASLRETRYIVPQAVWLLRLTGTNLAELEIAAAILERKGYAEYVAALLAPKKDSLTPRLESIYLKVLFDQGNFRAFAARWAEVREKVAADAELQLYHAAHLAMQGSPAESVEALKTLDQAVTDSAHRVLACRLRLLVSAQRNETAEYEKLLKLLEEWRADTLSQHIGYWKLLIASGASAKAAELAQAYPGAPRTPGELIELARVFTLMGLRERATALFGRYALEFGAAPNFWLAYANEFIETQNWTELRNLAVQIRSQPSVSDALGGFSYFLEGRAEWALQRFELADAAFAKMTERGFEYPQLALKTAAELLNMRRPALARDVLRKREEELRSEPNYWMLLFAAADGLKDCELMLSAARQSYVLQPNSPNAINNYAASLLILRQNPEEAVRLTLQLLAQNPGSVVAQVNHAAALLSNERAGEAETLLKSVRTNGLNRAQASLYNLDLFEIQYRLGHLEQARATTKLIEEEFLYPPQRAWLAKIRKELRPPDAKQQKAEDKG